MEEGRNFLKEIENENKAKAMSENKESSFKASNKAINRIKKEAGADASESSDAADEENKDAEMESEDKVGDIPMPKSMFAKPPPKFTGKLPKTTATSGDQEQTTFKSKLTKNYDPVSWSEIFDDREVIEDVIPVYYAGSKGPIIFCIHGAGHSALSYAPLAKEVKDFARIVTFDLRGHGGHHIDDETNMPIGILMDECMTVLKHVLQKYHESSVIICGHSLGGALAAKLTYNIIHPDDTNKDFGFDTNQIKGLFVIDVAEGSALSALPYMEQIVESRPKSFESIQEAIKWGIMSGQVKQLESARITMPDLIIKEGNKYVWRTDLLGSKDNWKEWFEGMNKCFLNCDIPKTLVIASNDRMDKELTIAQMQGKFKLASLYDVGHTIQEDAPKNLAEKFKEFINVFMIQEKYNQKKVITNASGKQIVIDH